MPTVEDYFDDETDLPLPSSSRPRPLPNTGQRGALIEEIGDSDGEDDFDTDKLAEQSRGIFGENVAPPAPSTDAKGKMTMRDDSGAMRPTGPTGGEQSMMGPDGMPNINPNTPMGGFMGDMMRLQQAEEERMAKMRRQMGSSNVQLDPEVYKGWNSVYPLYFDAKVSVSGGRRVPRKSSFWWPQANQIALACRFLALPVVLEHDKIHPADWENPGRAKVQIVKDGKFLNPIIKNRAQLYQHIAAQMRNRDPKGAYTPRQKAEKNEKDAKLPSRSGKAKAKSRKAKTPSDAVITPRPPTRVPSAPQPIPKLEDRFPLHSPVHPTGVAVSSIQREIETEKENKKKGITGGAGEEGGKEKMPKMKRVVVRGPKR